MRSKISKENLIIEISSMLGIPSPKVSTGSTEPKELFLQINDLLGLAIPTNMQKPDIAQQIVELSGGTWTADCKSMGGTVTNMGLVKVRDAVSFFTSSKKSIR